MCTVKCSICEKTFSSQFLLIQHLNLQHNVASSSTTHNKNIIKRKTSDKNQKVDFKKSKRNTDMITCVSCGIDIQKSLMHTHKRTNEHKTKCSAAYKENNIDIINTAFKSRVNTFRVKNMKNEELSIENFLNCISASVFFLITESIQTHTSLKVNVEVFCGYMLEKGDAYQYEIKSFNTKNNVITLSTELSEVYNTWVNVIKTKSEEFSDRESGWHLLEILHLEVNINKYSPLRGSSYIKLPQIIENKQAVVNVKNYDNECFGHSIISALRPVKNNASVLSSYPNFRSVLNFQNIEFPIKFSDIHKFESQNNISVNVFGLNQKKDKIMGPLHHTKQRQPIHINLLYIEDKEKTHFCWIKNLPRLVSKQLSLNTRRKHICDGCLQYFPKQNRLLDHQKDECGKIRTILPFGGIF